MKLTTMLLAILLLSSSAMLGAKKATKKAAPKKKYEADIANVAQPEKAQKAKTQSGAGQKAEK